MINVLGGINMTFGEKLKKLRIEQKLSQEDLANQLGVSRQAISKWEQDIALPDTNNLILIAKIFKVSLDDLVNYNDDLNNSNNNNNIINETDEKSQEKKGEKEYETFEKTPLFAILAAIIFVSCFLVFILIGIYVNNGWNFSWIAILFIPILLSLIESIKRKKISAFLFPVLIVAIYCFIGMLYGLWHPYWFLFLFIPLFYIIAEPIDKIIIAKKQKTK